MMMLHSITLENNNNLKLIFPLKLLSEILIKKKKKKKKKKN
jgi:hypothetical protein